MRFMLVIHPQFPLPPEHVGTLVDGFTAWWNRYRDRFDSAGFFAGGSGGGGICNVADPAELQQMMMEWPLTPFSQIESYALVDMDTALDQWRAMVASMGSAQGQIPT